MNNYKSSFLCLVFVFVSVLNFGSKINEINFIELDQKLQKEYSEVFAFSILIERADEILFNNEYGFIDKNKTTSTNENSLFNIASITKSITAVGIINLVEQGKIKLNDKIEIFFKNVPEDKQGITIGYLLSHKAGFPHNYILDGEQDSVKALKKLLKDKLKFKPGTGLSYSNNNYQLLALIIEQVTQLSYEEFIRKEILDLLDMKNTFFWHEGNIKKNVAGKKENLANNIVKRNWGWIGGAGIYSNTTDLYKFWNGVYDCKIISKSSKDLLLKSYFKTKSGINIGYGFFINDSTKWNSKEIWTRGSESWGHNAVIRYFPEKDVTIIVCTNSGEFGDKQKTGNRLISDMIADYLWK